MHALVWHSHLCHRPSGKIVLWLAVAVVSPHDVLTHCRTQIFYWEAACPRADLQGIWANTTSREMLSAMNKAVKHAILPFVQQTVTQMQDGSHNNRTSAAWHGTFALFEPTCERLDLNRDGVHFDPVWYDVVASMLLNGNCRTAEQSL